MLTVRVFRVNAKSYRHFSSPQTYRDNKKHLEFRLKSLFYGALFAVFMPIKEKIANTYVSAILNSNGATGGNQTRVYSLGSYRSIIELRPQNNARLLCLAFIYFNN